MEYRMSVRGPAGNLETLRVESDRFVLEGIIEALTAQFNWVWENKWPGDTKSDWSSRIGTAKQWENEFLGTVTILKL